MEKDRFGYGVEKNPNSKNEETWNFINSSDGVKFVEQIIREYGPEEMGKMVLGHFLETGEYLPKAEMNNETLERMKKGNYTTEYAHADWIGEMFFNAREGKQ